MHHLPAARGRLLRPGEGRDGGRQPRPSQGRAGALRARRSGVFPGEVAHRPRCLGAPLCRPETPTPTAVVGGGPGAAGADPPAPLPRRLRRPGLRRHPSRSPQLRGRRRCRLAGRWGTKLHEGTWGAAPAGPRRTLRNGSFPSPFPDHREPSSSFQPQVSMATAEDEQPNREAQRGILIPSPST